MIDEMKGPLLVERLWRAAIPNVHAPAPLLHSILALLILVGMAAAARLAMSMIPGRAQNAMELAWDYIESLVCQIAGPVAVRCTPFFVTLFLFIMVSNWMGLVPGFASPTANMSVNAALAVTVAAAAEWISVRERGLVGYFKHYLGPPYWLAPLLAPIRLMEVVTRPLSLTMRLSGNMMAKEIMLAVLVYLITVFFFSDNVIARGLIMVPILLRPLVILLGILVGFVQALVFTALSISYIGAAFEH